MARLARLFVPGCPQHIIQRGHNRMPVFADDEDRQRYLAWLVDALGKHQVALHAYVLMDNHVHLLVSAGTAAGASAVMQSVGRRYTQHFNRRQRRSGTLWEGRFRSTVVASDDYVIACYRYIDLNPVRAGLVESPAGHVWSSYLHHVGQRHDAFLADHALYWALGNTPFERQASYERLCAQTVDPRLTAQITDTALNGWSLGEPAEAGVPATRRLQRRQPGRPPKSAASRPDR